MKKPRYIEIVEKENLKELRYEALNEEDMNVLAQPNIIRVVIYARYSSDMQREESIDAQLRYCKEEIARNPNMVLVGVYYDEALSAKDDIEKRDDFQLMIKDGMKHDKFDLILVHKFNRFARNKFDSAVYKKKLRETGIRVLSATQKIEDSPEGRMMESVIEAMDEYYSDNLGLEVKKGLRENAYLGKHIGIAPLGYVIDEEGKLREDKKTSFLVRTMFDMYLQGHGMQSIALYLNGKGYRTPRGKMFSTKAISAILKNERYTGTYLADVAGEHFRIENNHDVLIDKMSFHRAMELRKKANSKPRIKSKNLYSLTGKMTCALCGANYCGGGKSKSRIVKGVHKGVVYYICPNKKFGKCTNTSVNRDKIEKLICNHILENLLTDESIEKIADEFEAVLKEYQESVPDEALSTLKAELRKLKVQEEKLLDLYLDPESELDKNTLNERVVKTKARIKAIEKEIKSHYVTENFKMGRADAVQYLHDLKDNFDMEDKFSVKAFMDTFVENVIIKKQDIEILYKVDFNQKMYEALGSDNPQGSVEVSKTDDYSDIVTSRSGLFIISPTFFKQCISKHELKYMKFK